MKPLLSRVVFFSFFSLATASLHAVDWAQLQGDARRSGNAPGEVLKKQLGLLAAVSLTDGVQAAPVVREGMVFVVDGSGVVHAVDIALGQVRWRFKERTP